MKHAVDVGNYAIKYLRGSEVQKVRSMYHRLTEGDRVQKSSGDSPLFVSDTLGRMHFGASARYYQHPQALVNSDKLDPSLFVPAVLATLEDPANQQRIELTVSVPAEYQETNALVAALTGRHRFYRNGVEFTVNIVSVRVVLEGLGAWHYAKSLGLVDPEGFSLVVDLGGGTVNGLVLSEDGDVLGTPISLAKAGGVALARRIAASPKLAKELQNQPDISRIMDGIANGTWTYGKHSFQEYGLAHIEPWFSDVARRLSMLVTEYQESIFTVLVVGGNANLVHDYLPSGWTVPELPQEANIRGLQYA